MPNANADSLRDILKECVWIIKNIELQNEDYDRVLGYEFQFMAEGVLTLSNGINISEGTWEIKFNTEQKLVIAIEMPDESGVSFEWPILEMFNDRLKFEADEIGYGLNLQRVCDNNANDGDVAEIRNFIMGGEWLVATYLEIVMISLKYI